MLSKNTIKLIASLSQKKFRTQHQLFIVEGVKGIQEFLDSSFELYQLFATEANFSAETILISEKELQKISNLKSPNTALAIFKIPKQKTAEANGLILVLDEIRDPGNLGTIIRLCDWFGVKTLVCSEGTVDCYNPKVVQATMGSLARVHISYTNLSNYLKTANSAVFGTFMEGNNIYTEELPKEGIIVMGNEANGISLEVEQLIHKKLSIPRFGNLQTTESLNVATAAAVVLSAFRRGF
ncbi:RNA methyltransferase [Subsaximicrobium wynnwilliamsii]|uniref:RNA methyltransferase n=1 Tax=Subsaximicrobium wynnwilliamsii TaxID=291179 RepID=A0A5C6ZJ76_9FLAO|nr:RNA methyltransferase [Subsaximicrobium wynnwilliamsii]TXD83366.1 RNA methyltransferase [Subsaximicrobium wynnwilliamsii]TXD89097.1 RNA methyltransferase [Subsaximicrobium wynnwilliamsii]TXE03390.1 RNA methyltransferase [Subsaximicrobium wynnwilliamsii]